MRGGVGDKIFDLSNNEKSRLIGTKIKQPWTQNFYRYENQDNDDGYVDDMK